MSKKDDDLVKKQVVELNKAFKKTTGYSMQQFNIEFEFPCFIRELGFKTVLSKFKEGLVLLEERHANLCYGIIKGLCREEIELRIQKKSSTKAKKKS